MFSEAEQAGHPAGDLDRHAAAFRPRVQDHLLDHLAQQRRRFPSRIRPGEGGLQRIDLLPIGVGQPRVQLHRGRLRRPLQRVDQLGAPGLELEQPGRQSGRIDAALDHADETSDSPRDFLQFTDLAGAATLVGLVLRAQAFVHFADHLGQLVGLQQAFLDGVEDARLDLRHRHGPAVFARAALLVIGAGDAVAADGGAGAAARGAEQQPGEQPLGPADHRAARALAIGALDGLAAVPQVLRHDAQIGHRMTDPLLGRIGPRLAPAGVGILDEALTIVDQHADIDLVVQDAVDPAAAAADRAVAPQAAARRRHALTIEPPGDLARAVAGGIFGEDAQHDGGGRGVDRAPAGQAVALGVALVLGDDVAVAQAAGAQARLDIADLAAPRLVAEILEVARAHDALDADVEIGDLAVAERDDADAGV